METTIAVGTALAFLAFIIGQVVQTRRIWKRRTSNDISLIEVGLRLGASILLLIKFCLVNDGALIAGQVALLVVMGINTAVIIRFRNGHRSPE